MEPAHREETRLGGESYTSHKRRVTPLYADVIGDVPAASFPVFTSDHAGIVATVELP